jgi:hypothetical protein
MSWFRYRSREYDLFELKLNRIIANSHDSRAIKQAEFFLHVIKTQKNCSLTSKQNQNLKKIAIDFDLSQIDEQVYDNTSDFDSVEDLDIMADVGDWFAKE